MEDFSTHKPTHLEFAVAWWVFANMYPSYTIRSFLSNEYSQARAYNCHWFQLFIAAMKGEI